jgi:RNA polymerase sigma factor (TIGR02999 family)
MDAPSDGPTRAESLDGLMLIAYEHLRKIARVQRSLRGGNSTLNTTGLVHEAYLKLSDQARDTWNDRAHFFALASIAMRHVLVDQAKARLTQKRGGDLHQVTLDNVHVAVESQPAVLLDINEALDRLAAEEPRLARVVECRFFGGLSDVETAEALQVTIRTVQRDWVKARMLLRRALSG